MAGQLIGGVGSLLCFGLFGWLFPLLGIIIGGLIIHLFLKIFGGANQGLTMTLRVISYAYAPQIFAAVPFVDDLDFSVRNHRFGCIGSYSADGFVYLCNRFVLRCSYCSACFKRAVQARPLI